MRIIDIYFKENDRYAVCVSDHGDCYGGEREFSVDCSGVPSNRLATHLDKYAGKAYGDFLRKKRSGAIANENN